MSKNILTLMLTLLISCSRYNALPPAGITEHPTEHEINPDTDPGDVDSAEEVTSAMPKMDTDNKNIPVVVENQETERSPEAMALNVAEEDLNLAKAIYRWKMRIDRGLWVECGRKYGKEEIKEAALEWAKAINSSWKTAHYTLRSGKEVQVDRKEAVGIIMNESRFDRCAVGPHPRNFAYDLGILKKKKWHISHSLDELEKVFTHPKFQGRKADLGGGQIVVKIGKNHHNWGDIQNYLSVVPGVQIVFDEMVRRGEMFSTRTPSDRWPGSQRHATYTLRIMRMSSAIFQYM